MRIGITYLSLGLTMTSVLLIFYYILSIFAYNQTHLTPVMKNYVKQHHGENEMKYILQWTLPYTIPFVEMDKGQNAFQKYNCKVQNCYVTNDKNLFPDLREFDVIAFHGPEIITPKKMSYPKIRSPKQKYVFASIESSHYYPVCDTKFDGYFNWTWTYKLKSDETYGYISIWNKHHELIGPKEEMHWMNVKDMAPISDEMKAKLNSKSKAALWVASNCESRSKREKLVEKIKKELSVYDLHVDILGRCGNHTCHEADCFGNIERDYYFYLAFENSFSEDYVTEKLLHALEHNAIPIVYGGANYSRFMPEGIYLDAKKLNPKDLAREMFSIIKDKEKYYDYFKWKEYYRYSDKQSEPDSNDYCRMCEMINDSELMERTTVYENFKAWWNPPGVCT